MAKSVEEQDLANMLAYELLKRQVCRLGFIEVSPKKRNQSVGNFLYNLKKRRDYEKTKKPY